MLKAIFPNNVYSVISPLNRSSLINIVERTNLKKEQYIRWHNENPLYNDDEGRNITVELLEEEELYEAILPSVYIFLKLLQIEDEIDIKLNEIWRTTYKKGGWQELHDHTPDSDVSGVLFLDEPDEDSGKFFFFNKQLAEIPSSLRRLSNIPSCSCVNYRQGDILFFPSHMLHGVTPHKSNKPRRTVSFNFKLVE